MKQQYRGAWEGGLETLTESATLCVLKLLSLNTYYYMGFFKKCTVAFYSYTG